MSAAEIRSLPAVVDVVTAGRALGMGRTKSYELARAGRFPARCCRSAAVTGCPSSAFSSCWDSMTAVGGLDRKASNGRACRNHLQSVRMPFP